MQMCVCFCILALWKETTFRSVKRALFEPLQMTAKKQERLLLKEAVR